MVNQLPNQADTQAVTNRPWRQGVGVYADGFIDFFRFFGIDEHTDPNRIAQILTVAAQDNVDDAIMRDAKIALFDAPAIAAYARRRKAYLAARGTANRLSRRQPKNNAQPVSARIVGWTVFVLVFLVVMVWVSARSDRAAESAAAENTAARPTPAPKPPADMSGFTPDRRLIPSDEPSTEYYLIFYKKEAARLQTVTERRGTSGVSYAWRELDCAAGMQRYLGAGDSLDAAMVFKPDAAMSTPDADSSAGRILDFACRNV